MLVLQVLPDEEGLRPDRLLRRRYPQVDRPKALALLKGGRVLVDGERARLATVVRAGQRVEVEVSLVEAGRPADVREPTVLYLDSGVCVLDKPAGMAMHGGTGVGADEPTLHGWVRSHLDVEAGLSGPSFLGRLDRLTSGLVIAALSRAGLEAVGPAWSRGAFEKAYLTLVHGRVDGAGVIDVPLVARRERHRGKGRVEVAITHFASLASSRAASLLLVFPETGRTHQIRRHMKAVGHPVVGDPRHGDPRRDRALGVETRGEGAAGLMLHAYRYRHSDEGIGLPSAIRAAVPERMRRMADALGLGIEEAERVAEEVSLSE